MRFFAGFIVIVSVFLASALAWGQTQMNASTSVPVRTSLLVRMSFASTWEEQDGFGNSPQICFSVDRTGHYQMRRLTKLRRSIKKDNAEIIEETLIPELIRGTLPPNELAKLEKLLEDPEFLRLSGPVPNLLREGAETLVAEVPRENGVQRVVASDADRANPLPRSASEIVNWLKHFKAENAEPLDVSTQDICPSRAVQPVRPTNALLEPASPYGACVSR